MGRCRIRLYNYPGNLYGYRISWSEDGNVKGRIRDGHVASGTEVENV